MDPLSRRPSESESRRNAPKRYLNTEQVAEMLGLEAGTLADWRYQRRGPPWISVTRGCVRYDLDELEVWLESRTVRELTE